MNLKTRFIAACTAGLLLLLPLGNLLAQETEVVRLGLSPLIYELGADPGDTFKREIRITNGSEHELVLGGKAEDFVAGGEQGQPQIIEESEPEGSPWSLKKWLMFAEKEFSLGPGQTKAFEFEIDVPSDAEPGGHYGMVRFETLPPDAGGDAGVGLVGSVGTLVLLNVSGEVRRAGRIVSLSAVKDLKQKDPKPVRFFPGGPVGLLVRFKNTGTVHYKPKGEVVIDPLIGPTRLLEIGGDTVLPDSIRRYGVTWDKPPTIGRFVATATMKFGGGETARSKPYVFYIIPWPLVFVILLILAVIGYLTYRVTSLSRRLRRAEAQREPQRAPPP